MHAGAGSRAFVGRTSILGGHGSRQPLAGLRLGSEDIQGKSPFVWFWLLFTDKTRTFQHTQCGALVELVSAILAARLQVRVSLHSFSASACASPSRAAG